jgi:tRNA-specific 2-thiouridylase
MFSTPFCLCDKCYAASVVKKFSLKAHKIVLGQQYLDLVSNPPSGYGSQMNPCLDCRILMLQKAKDLAGEVGAECLVTGEVLNQRPFSQTKHALNSIEKRAGLKGKILRPLSAKLLKETEAEQKGIIDREQLYSIQGRRRLPQMDLAKQWGIKDYPCPSGGCLLTDPCFADRLKDHLEHNEILTLNDVMLLRLGRHFRINGAKIIVGRNERENNKLLVQAKKQKLVYLELIDFMGPITVMDKICDADVFTSAQILTIKYSDVICCNDVRIKVADGENETIIVRSSSGLEEDNFSPI